jgi:hypothetical protein
MITFLIVGAITGECYHWNYTWKYKSYQKNCAIYLHNKMITDQYARLFNRNMWTFIWSTCHTNAGYYVMEHNIQLFKPKNGFILNLRHIVFNITIIKILLFLHQLQVTTCTQLMPCWTK